ncbi:M28 family peptidase [Conexibacter stalactiti]|uniref:M28 family peptidase n=1 Tax=Conexibacter stalactiti TaxID=1940611 RepID=A0ABU4HZ53_9ACTN|nr:M28 family peptidase [Conexibacter stalactiti]MDW5598626.1 M28 family peptidase [Conexibacter stalactiti]MEC5039268.1 M28 family peptidase [Conexibacter stalactiti]
MSADAIDPQLRADVERLAAMTRDSAGAGERAAAAWVAERLRAAGVQEVRSEPFRYTPTYTHAYALHAGAIGAAAALGGRGGRLLALAALASHELDVSGRRQWLRRWLPAGEGANVVGRLPARGPRRATLLLVAHHDAARTGLIWHPALSRGGAAARLRRRAMEPAGWPFALAALAAASGTRAGRALGGTLAAATVALMADVHRSPTVPGASDNATGVAALLALAGRLAHDPPDGLETIVLSSGCEEPGMGGMAAFLAAHGDTLDRATTFVLGLDTLGAGEPIVARAEGVLLPHTYAARDNDLVDAAARRAGLPPPQRWRIGAYTDPILARFAGLRAVSLLSVGADGRYSDYHLPTDTAERVGWRSVARCLALAEATARELVA